MDVSVDASLNNILDAQAFFASEQNVSRETFLLFERYVALLLKWNSRINLIGPSTEATIWNRHILDAWQIASLIPPHHRIIDMGSGAGLPGLVLSMLGYDVTMVESDARKAIFIQESIRELELHASIHNSRVESVVDGKFDTVTARALAPLLQLLSYGSRHMGINGQCIFPKGENYSIELEDARKQWRFDVTVHPSQCHPKSGILQCSNVVRCES